MRALVLLGGLAGCYSPHAATGSPCSPTLANCPSGQTCQPTAAGYACSTAATTDAPLAIDARFDAPRGLDAARDVPPPAPWSLVQTASSMTPVANVTPTGAGHVLIVAVQTAATGTVNTVTDAAGDTFTAIPQARAVHSSANLGVELWYATSSHAGATAVTTLAMGFRGIVVWEVAGLGALDAVSTLDDQPVTTQPVGAAITTTAPGELVVSAAIVANNITGIHPGNDFTNDEAPNGNGFAHVTDPAAPAGVHAARWDQPNPGPYCAASAAFFAGP